VLCGMISQYNSAAPGPANLARLITQRGRMEGFLCTDYYPRAAEAYGELIPWLTSGKLQYHMHVVDGLENAPLALNRLFDGSNTGKLVVKVSDEPVEPRLAEYIN
jgi:NADPH-dependent curcumin reductase CurA